MNNSINSSNGSNTTMARLIARAESELAEIYEARNRGHDGHYRYDQLCQASRDGNTPSAELLARHRAEEDRERDEDCALYEYMKDAERWLAIVSA